MTVVALGQQEDRESGKEALWNQMAGCQTVREDIKIIIWNFLLEQGIHHLGDIEEETLSYLRAYLEQQGICAKKDKRLCFSAVNKLKNHHMSVVYNGLIGEITGCGLNRAVRNRLIGFMIDHGVKTISEVDYGLREQYEETLRMSPAKTMEYTKAMDKVKLIYIKKQEQLKVLNKRPVSFKEEKMFLLYYPVYEIASAFYYTRDKKELLWDFSLKAPYKMKQQVFQMLQHVLHDISPGNDRRIRFLSPLRWLYEFCVDEGIEDIEQLEQAQVEAFRGKVEGKVVNVGQSMQIVDNIRKHLFLTAHETNWEASVWYVERFCLPDSRMNPSNPVYRISFCDITDSGNRALLQAYIKYQIGITDEAICNIRKGCYIITAFLKYFDDTGKSVLECTTEDMESYFRYLDGVETLSDTFNKKIVCIFRFFRFLQVRGLISGPPFLMEYYLKSTFPAHHDRSVPPEVIRQILWNLDKIPMVLRLMYLNLWCIGLRLNEVCTLKGDAYFWRNDAAWIKVYQYKMNSEKVIPIPTVLYQLMTGYIKENHIRPGQYVFRSARGTAYHVGTFSKQMTEQLERIGISCQGYDFKSHDYRHTVATLLDAHGVSLQAIRDYLGHDDEKMTMQYVDYMPKKIQAANRNYFSQPGNSLASCLKKGVNSVIRDGE